MKFQKKIIIIIIIIIERCRTFKLLITLFSVTKTIDLVVAICLRGRKDCNCEF